MNDLAIGAKLYQKRSRVRFFLITYAVLAAIGAALIILALLQEQSAPGVAGFTLSFGAGMTILTWIKSRRPQITVRDEHLELHQQNKPVIVRYKSISNVTHAKDGRLVLAIREGHDIKNITVWLKMLEDADAEHLVNFCKNKGWKS